MCELRDEIPQLILSLELDPAPEFDLEELLEAIILLYFDNYDDILGAYIPPDYFQGRGGASSLTGLASRMGLDPMQKQAVTTTSPDSGMMMASSQTSQGNALLSSPTRPADVAYNYALAELNPIRYRGYYWDAETGWYFCQTRYYNPQWRRFINADVLFIAGDDVLNAVNLYAYCNGNPVMYADPNGMAVDDLRVFLESLVVIVTALAGSARTFFSLTGVIYGEEHGTFYIEDGYGKIEDDRPWREGQYAIATIIWNAYTDTTLYDFRNRNTLWAIISDTGFNTFRSTYNRFPRELRTCIHKRLSNVWKWEIFMTASAEAVVIS